ncbi:MAG: hypothetical protein VW945_05275, partial [Candidatus Poseidoniales archaeon]
MVGLIAITLMLAGCVEEQPAAEEEEAPVLAVANVFPAWEGVDHTNMSHTSGSFTNQSYLAYFSAPW